MRYLIVLFLASIATLVYAQQGGTNSKFGRYQIVPTSHGMHSVFKIDTASGDVSYCYTYVVDTTGPVQGVHCVLQK